VLDLSAFVGRPPLNGLILRETLEIRNVSVKTDPLGKINDLLIVLP